MEAVSSKMPELKKVYSRARVAKILSFDQVGPETVKLPRFLYKDKRAIKASQKSLRHFANRASQLAKQELSEINKIISKMQIIESEVIQKLNLLTHTKGRKKISDFAKAKNELIFPGDKEVWFDELGHFKAEVEKCPKRKQRASL